MLRVKMDSFLFQVGCINDLELVSCPTPIPPASIAFLFHLLFGLTIKIVHSSYHHLYFGFLLSVSVCVTGDLQAYALRPVTTTAGLNQGVVVGTGSAQSLQVTILY